MNIPIMLPNEEERRKIFYWLKKISSLTAWRHICSCYKEWANITEESVRKADELGWIAETALPESHYLLILKGLAHCREGVERLSRGDKRVFKFDANGEFEMGGRVLSHWSQMKTRIEEGENGIDEQHTPLWSEFIKAMKRTHDNWQHCAFQILEPRYLDEPALTKYSEWLKDYLQKLYFPDVLMDVPDPTDNIFVRSNQYTPCSGIWEPIDAVKKKSSFFSLLTSSPKPMPPFRLVGTMSYLHAGSKAPQIDVDAGNDTITLDTTWRLLWRDDRYHDCSVPDEEAAYRFEEWRHQQRT